MTGYTLVDGSSAVEEPAFMQPGDGVVKILQNAGDHLSDYMASHPRKLQY